MPEIIAHCATKGALDTFTLNLAQELGPRGITSMAALGRVGQPEDIADIVAFLASDEARWVTGRVVDATGGARLRADTYRCLCRYIWVRLARGRARVPAMSSARVQGIRNDDDAYLREIERLARRVVAVGGSSDGVATPLRRALVALGRALRHEHFEGDGCAEALDAEAGVAEPPVFVRLAAVALLTPSNVHPELGTSYEHACDQLGVPATAYGWALWHTWAVAEPRVPVTMVVRSIATTTGLMRNWAQGREVLPVTPAPSEIGAVRMGWWRMQAAVMSPAGVRRLGLTDTNSES